MFSFFGRRNGGKEIDGFGVFVIDVVFDRFGAFRVEGVIGAGDGEFVFGSFGDLRFCFCDAGKANLAVRRAGNMEEAGTSGLEIEACYFRAYKGQFHSVLRKHLPSSLVKALRCTEMMIQMKKTLLLEEIGGKGHSTTEAILGMELHSPLMDFAVNAL
ncbi:hypothetical protein QJS10_CPB14g00741 [Acorus calamus]|uniref:Uncharacterized protein n=1 Tax=Acorus calamus TaxID=4465 RepID=A0AAV9DD52_ACOCL|nr:hypothetical protein QJS10_CPB14g00741 [Acorus calamus]